MHPMIKKALLLLCICVLAICGHADAQTMYQLTVSYSIQGSGHKAECSSRYEIWAQMENGEERRIASEDIDFLETWEHWGFEPKTITFPSNNRVRRLRIYALRRYENAVDCKTADDGDRYTPYFSYPCYNGSFKGLFVAYGSESTLDVSIKPVSNAYNLQIATNEVFNGANITAFNYRITAIYTDGSEEEVAQIYYPGSAPRNSTQSHVTNAVHIGTRKQVRTLRVYSTGVVLSFPPRAQERTNDINITNDYDQVLPDPFIDAMDNGSSIHITYRPVNIPLTYGPDPLSNILPASGQVYLEGPTDLPPGEYKWSYSVAGQPFQDFPARLQGQNPVRFSGSDIFADRYLDYLNQNIMFRMVPLCASDRQSSIVTLNYRLDAPYIESITPKHISCNGVRDGGLTMKFKRPLHTGESMTIRVREVPSDNLVDFDDNATIGPDGTYTWPASMPLPAGNFRVEVSTFYNGSGTYNGAPEHKAAFTIDEPTAVTFTGPTPANVKCYGGSDGSISLNANGGSGGYSLLYKGPADAGYNTLPFAGNAITLGGLGIGNYLLQVKDQRGCQGTGPSGVTETSVTIGQPDAALTIDGMSLTDPKAFGYTDGNVIVTLKGGTPNGDGSYNVEWRSADGTLLSAAGTSSGGMYTTRLSNLPDGSYTLTVTDANYTAATGNRDGCTLTGTFTLRQPPLLTAAIRITDSIRCNGDGNGTLTAVAGGGKPFGAAPGYTYVWYEVVGGTATPIGQTNAVADNLSAGMYQVKVTDANGIEKWSAITTLVDPAPLQVQLTATPASCHAGSNGVINAQVTGGTLVYTYNWSNGSEAAVNDNLPAGTYTLNVTDYHGCEVSDLAIIREPAAALQIEQPVLTLPLASGYSDGSIKVLLTGGTALAGGAYNITWQRADGTVLTGHTGQAVAGGYESLLSNITAGDYTIIVTDANYTGPDANMRGCTATATFSLTEPPPLLVDISRRRYISCKGDADGILAATARGGVPIATGSLPYRFEWYRQAGGAYNAIGQTTDVASGLITGTYKVIITDWNGITKESAPFVLAEPGLLQVQLATQPVTCASGADGAVTSTVTGGTSPFHYEWTTGDTTASISSLTEGSYLVFVKDAHGCETQQQADVFIPNGIVVDADITSPTCTGDCDGAINTLISGGTPPYRLAWNTGSANSSLDQLCAGKYTLTIQDANNCRRVQSFNLPDPAPLKVSLGADKTLCNGQVWQANATIADRLATYSWGGDPAIQATTPQVTLSRSGQYWVAVTDSKGCTGNDTIRIQQRASPIEAEFVVSTQVFRNENVSLINISNPLPEKVEWVIPANRNITVLQNTPLLAELRFADTGVYRIQLRSYVGDCEKVFTKEISVLEQQSFTQPGGAQQPFIQKFEISPNPNTGQFNVRITLDKAAEVRLRLLNIISNQLVNDRKESPATQFNIGYQLNVTAGTYVLLLETPMGHAIRKIVISQ